MTPCRLRPRRSIFLAGHQPQLFHPGVWFKNFALDRLARRHGAVAVNLVVDSDTIKSHRRARARRVGRPAARVEVPPGRARPGGSLTKNGGSWQRELFADFGAAAPRSRSARLCPTRCVREFWPLAVERIARDRQPGGVPGSVAAPAGSALGAGRRWRCRRAGCASRSRSRWFARTCWPQLPRFRAGLQRGGGRVSPRAPHPQRGPSGARPGRRRPLAGGPVLDLDAENPRAPGRCSPRKRRAQVVLSDRQSLEFVLPLAAGRPTHAGRCSSSWSFPAAA